MSEIEVFYSLMVIVFSIVAIAIGVITARELIRKIKRGLTKRAADGGLVRVDEELFKIQPVGKRGKFTIRRR